MSCAVGRFRSNAFANEIDTEDLGSQRLRFFNLETKKPREKRGSQLKYQITFYVGFFLRLAKPIPAMPVAMRRSVEGSGTTVPFKVK